MLEAKAKVRKGTLYNRRLLADEVWQKRCELVAERANQFVLQRKIRTIHLFLPIDKNKEINTWPLLASLSKVGIRLVLSRTDFKTREMTHVWYSPELKFETDSYGIPSPLNGAPANFSEVELVFLPLLASDKNGNRIGYGKGYYDQLLKDSRNDLLKVGLSITPPFDSFPFHEAHDIRLDYLITHHETYTCHD